MAELLIFLFQFHTQESSRGWVEATGQPLYNSDLSEMLLIEEVSHHHHHYHYHHDDDQVSQGEGGTWAQVVRGLVSVTDTIPVTTLSHGHFQVTKLLSWDRTNDWM